VGGLAVALLVAGGYIAYNQMKPQKVEPPVTQASLAPATTLAPPVTAAPVTTLPPTAAPPPTFAEAVGKGAAAMKAAQRAFTNGDYGRAVSEAQAALREDPQNGSARRMIDQAEKGQQAQAKLRSAQAALGRKEWAQAIADASAARDLAPWEAGVSEVIGRAQRGQQQAQEDLENTRRGQLAAQTNALLAQAEQQLQAQKWDAAVALYDEALKLDPNNQRAALGRTSAIAGKAVATSGGGGGGTRPGTRSFTVGKTTAQASADRGSNTPAGFEETPGLVVKKGTSAADLPGKLGFDVEPQSPTPGQRYSVKVYLTNEGNAPIQIAQMVVTTTINGKRASAPLAPQAKDAAPGQKTMLASIGPDTWKEDTSDWSMEVQVRTTRGEKYTNAVSWK
jgi:tetratricopeptide (TPR) repeat protein